MRSKRTNSNLSYYMIDSIDSEGLSLSRWPLACSLVCPLEFELTFPALPTEKNLCKFKRMLARFILVVVLTDLIFLLVKSVSFYVKKIEYNLLNLLFF